MLYVNLFNAFNSVSCPAIFEGLRAFPLACLIPLVRSFYSFAAPLYHVQQDRGGAVTFCSTTGTRLEDLFDGALFAFGVHGVPLSDPAISSAWCPLLHKCWSCIGASIAAFDEWPESSLVLS